MTSKWDNFWLGLLAGLILPALFCLAYAHTISLDHLWQEGMFQTLRPVIGRMVLLGTFVNMAATFVWPPPLSSFDYLIYAVGRTRPFD